MLNLSLVLFLLLYLLMNNHSKPNLYITTVDENHRPIKDVHIYLKHCESEKVYHLTTNHQAQVMLEQMDPGKYEVSLYKLGFIEKKCFLNIQQNLNCSISICRRKKSRIYGYITDQLKNPISNATVVLYQLIGANSYRPIKTTHCDDTGEYNFIDVEPGQYMVKAVK